MRALSLTNNRQKLLAVNQPNNSLVVLDATSGLAKLDEIPVGLAPCSVAIQPGTNDSIAWVINFISDNVSVVDLSGGVVTAVLEVGDEPVDIVFNASGSFAFIVLQGSPIPGQGEPVVQDGALVALDTATLETVSKVVLDMNSPRSAVINHALNRVIVASRFSGNNTTVVGHPVPIRTAPPSVPPSSPCDPNCDPADNCAFFPLLGVVQAFTPTAALFSDPKLSPWPDEHEDPEFPASPLVERIVSDAGSPADVDHPWQQIVEMLSDSGGQPDPLMVDAMNTQFGIVNAFDIIEAVINDAKDTVDHDLAVVNVSDPAGAGLSVEHHIDQVGTLLAGMGIHPNGSVFVTNTEAQNVTRLEPNLRGHIVDHRVTIVAAPQSPGAIAQPTGLNAGIPGFNNVSAPNPVAQQLALAQPQAIEFNSSGSKAYGVAAGSGRLFVLDGMTASVLGRADIGTLPTALAVDTVGDRVFIMDRLDYAVYCVDVAQDNNMQLTCRQGLFNPEPAEIPRGRPFLYSTRFTNNFASSCATCHPSGQMDGLAWDLGDPHGELQPPPPPLLSNSHPIKGPMVTQTLQGLQTHEPFHWRGDRPTFQDFNPAFVGLLGAEVQLSNADMDAYTAFIKTIQYPPPPHRNRDSGFKDPGGGNGALLFGAEPGQSCNTCHEVNHGGALSGPNGDEGFSYIAPFFFGQLQLVPQNRGGNKKFRNELYCGFGLLHDGREDREDHGHPLLTFLNQIFCNLSQQQMADMVAFMEAFPTEVDPVVGWQVQAVADDDAQLNAVLSDINLMVTRHAEPESACDVVAKGVVGDQQHGYYLVATEPGVIFQSDIDTATTLDALLASLSGNDSLVFTAVPPGSGKRIGIDQDLDGMSDGLDPRPQHDDDGDVNEDGAVDGEDVQDFLTVMFDPGQAPYAIFNAADVDNDNDVDVDDATGIVPLLLADE